MTQITPISRVLREMTRIRMHDLSHPCNQRGARTTQRGTAPGLRPARSGLPSLLAMHDSLRVILEIGPTRRGVAGAADWPGVAPLQFLIRRTAQHAMDHAWEMEDRDLTS